MRRPWRQGSRLRTPRMRAARPSPLALEIAARAASARSRGALGRRRRHDDSGQAARAPRPGRDRPARRAAARRGAVVSATNGKTTTTAMAAEILAPAHRLAHNAAGANLVSGVASTLLAAPTTPSSGCSRWTRPRCRRSLRGCGRARVCLGNLFRDQLDRYGELELVAERWRDAVAGASRGDPDRLQRRRPAARARRRRRARARRVRARRPARRPPVAAARGRLEVLRPCGAPFEYAAAYVGHLGDYRCPSVRPRPAAARRRRARRRAARAGACRVPARHARRHRAGSSSRLPGLYNVYNAVAARRARARARREPRRDRGRRSALLRRRSAGSSGSRSATRILLLLIKNPAGANEASARSSTAARRACSSSR